MRRASFVLALFFCASSARAQLRPTAFFILQRSSPPPIDAAQLPPGARAAYEHITQLRATLRSAAEHLPEGELRRARLTRLSRALDVAWSALATALSAHRARLDAAGWLVLGEARFERANHDFLDALEAHDRDPEHASEPTRDYASAIDAYRRASALASDATLGAWARYLEAVCWTELGRADQATPALRIVAESAPSRLRGEARFRLGELAYDEGSFALAAAYYEEASGDMDPALRSILVYRLVWAYYRAGDGERALASIARMPSDAPRELVSDLDALREILRAERADQTASHAHAS